MHFGKRNIRSAGRSSGSVEITLPVELAILEGVACRLSLRDGLVPEIVLQPDLLVVIPVFVKLWSLLRLGRGLHDGLCSNLGRRLGGSLRRGLDRLGRALQQRFSYVFFFVLFRQEVLAR